MAENKKGAWSDAENYNMVFQVLQQVLASSKITVKFDQLNLPGRTPCAISDHWLILRKSATAPAAPASASARTPASGKKAKAEGKGTTGRKATTPSKRKTNGDGDMMDTTPTPKRRRSPNKKQPIMNEPDPEDSEDMPVLHDSSGDDDAASSPKSYHSYDYYE